MVTIIVLLILAGISIQMLSGNNGILQRAGQAKEATEYKQIEERIKLAYLATLTGNNGKFNMDIFTGELNNEFGENNYTLADDYSTITINNKEYNIEEYTNNLLRLNGWYKQYISFPAERGYPEHSIPKAIGMTYFNKGRAINIDTNGWDIYHDEYTSGWRVDNGIYNYASEDSRYLEYYSIDGDVLTMRRESNEGTEEEDFKILDENNNSMKLMLLELYNGSTDVLNAIYTFKRVEEPFLFSEPDSSNSEYIASLYSSRRDK